VAEVRERLSDDVAYNTVQTMLNRLETKGHVRRELHGRAYRYRSQLRQPSVAGNAVRSVIDRFFSGSAEALAAHLVSRGLSKRELDRVRKLIDEQRVKDKE
jgi:predicted transcriptional regulator